MFGDLVVYVLLILNIKDKFGIYMLVLDRVVWWDIFLRYMGFFIFLGYVILKYLYIRLVVVIYNFGCFLRFFIFMMGNNVGDFGIFIK